MPAPAPLRPRNDPAQYDDLTEAWWDLRGPFAMLHWLAAARARLVPPPPPGGGVLLDVGCGAGLLAPHLPSGWTHVGLDLSALSCAVAAEHGVTAVVADAHHLPMADSCADVVVAGEVLEHVTDVPRVVAECARVLRPGGTLVIDTIARTRLARLVAVTLAERLPGGPPPRLHDPALFIDRAALVQLCAEHGITLRLHGLRPSVSGYLLWLAGRRERATMVRAPSTAILFAGVGTSAPAPAPTHPTQEQP